MILKQLNLLPFFMVLVFGTAVVSCSDDDSESDVLQEEQVEEEEEEIEPETQLVTRYFSGIEFGSDPTVEILTNADSFEEGVISPVDNGFEQPAWMAYLQGEDQIITLGYNTAPEFTSYEVVDGALTKGNSFFTTDDAYAATFVDASTMVFITSPRSGLADKIISIVDTDAMEVTYSITTTAGYVDVDGDGDGLGEGDENDLIAFPSDIHVRGDYLYVSYYMMSASGTFSTPDANKARVGIYTYPGLEFVKVIEDDRASNISRYYAFNGLLEDENGDIYTFSPSSIASGYAPVPENNSAILRIKNGETEFDDDFYIDFESISGGLKINDMFYTTNGKAVVRATFEEESELYLWGNYAPTLATPLISTGIVDLTTGTFTLLDNVPLCGGGWNSPHMIDGSKVYLGVNNAEYSGVYIIDTETGTATEGADIDGNYAKALLSLTTEEVVE
ncbi:MAG: DUF4374 domain-containing protein [Bacteroidota bacterium]